MNKAIGYIRVSTNTQDISIEAQQVKIEEHCKLKGIELVEVVVDNGVSGSVPLYKRDGGKKIEDLINRGVKCIISAKMDRLFRSMIDGSAIIGKWNKQDVKLSVLDFDVDTTTSAGLLSFHLMTAVAEFERKNIASRIKVALGHKRSKGEATGGSRPYGFNKVSKDGVLVWEKVKEEQSVLKKVIKARKQGLSLRNIANYLNDEGFISAEGKRFHATTVSRIIKTSSKINTEMKAIGK